MRTALNRPVQVFKHNRLPFKIIWSEREAFVTKIIDYWKDIGDWWQGEGEKDFFRLYLDNGTLCEIYYDYQEDIWQLYKIYD